MKAACAFSKLLKPLYSLLTKFETLHPLYKLLFDLQGNFVKLPIKSGQGAGVLHFSQHSRSSWVERSSRYMCRAQLPINPQSFKRQTPRSRFQSRVKGISTLGECGLLIGGMLWKGLFRNTLWSILKDDSTKCVCILPVQLAAEMKLTFQFVGLYTGKFVGTCHHTKVFYQMLMRWNVKSVCAF